MSKSATKTMRTDRAPTTENGTVLDFPRNDERSRRAYLTPDEVDRLMKAARSRGRYGHRDGTMILLGYRHGLRVGELVTLRWDQIDLKLGRVHVRRLKGSEDSVHPLSGLEIRALRQVRKDQDGGRFVFMSERGAPMTTRGFFKLVAAAGAKAGLEDVHPHLLRHGTGYKLVNDGVDTRTIAAYLGHRNLQNTARYTAMSATRFNGLWQD
jgi:site-specific recombinase XerD